MESFETLAQMMKTALWDTRDARASGLAAPEVLRLKARISVAGHGSQIVQAVGDLYDTSLALRPPPDDAKQNQLLVIGRRLDLINWQTLLEKALRRP